ncbi:MFS transporter [Salarchaeum japonicum]|uniref:Major facilitator superfamily (MFS) profile domain-containing protein n=1 Tax=Salarchaeum japonicum TaxID=555573 RepID=A0AAV3SYC3_9EURY|nr:MFS transporter [Salarchaeum japonicum]
MTARTLRYAPHVAVFAVGYVTFTYSAVPGYVAARYGATITTVGFLMSAALLSFVLAQAVADRLASRWTTTQALLGLLGAHAALAVALDFAPSLESLLVLRALWGLAGGLLLSIGATHVARLYDGRAATRQQGVYGGMLTLGGAFGFLLAEPVVSLTGGFGVHALGAPLALPAIAMLWPHRRGTRTAGTAASGGFRTVLANRVVLVAALCYVATIGAYITLSTFITAYFDDLGVTGPLNAAVLATATAGRALGGTVSARWGVSDARIVSVTTLLGALAFVGLLVDARVVALVGPLVAMIAVSLPFGAVYNLAAAATAQETAALALVVAAGNVAAVALPTFTGVVRANTGGYAAVFCVLAALLLAASLAARQTR